MFQARFALLAALLPMAAATFAEAQIQTAGTLFVELNANDPSAATATWVNTGTLGDFIRNGTPTVANFGPNANVGVSYNGTTDFHRGPAAPASLTGAGAAGTRTIEVWTFNPTIPTEESLVSISKRGGPNGTNASFNYGTDGTFGAVGHWGPTDVGWNGAPVAGEWHHLVYTYDGATARVYEGGTLSNFNNVGSIDAHDGIDMLIASQMESNGTTPTAALRGSLGIAQVRIHDGALTAAQVANNYNVDAQSFGLVTKLPSAPENPIGEWNFSRTALSSSAVADGQAIPTSTAVDASLLRDDANGLARGSTVEAPHYRAYNVGELANRANVDGKALATGGAGVGEGYIYFNGEPTLSTNDTFSIWGRVKQLSNLGGDQFIFNRPGAWDLRVDADGDLLTSFGGVTEDTGFNVTPGEWFDVGLTYAGTGAAGTDLIEVFIDGQSLGTFDAGVFGTGDWLHFGAGPSGTADFHGLFDRVAFWDIVVSDSTFASLSASATVPEPVSIIIWSLLGALVAGGAWRARRK